MTKHYKPNDLGSHSRRRCAEGTGGGGGGEGGGGSGCSGGLGVAATGVAPGDAEGLRNLLRSAQGGAKWLLRRCSYGGLRRLGVGVRLRLGEPSGLIEGEAWRRRL